MDREQVEILLGNYFGVRPVPGEDVAPLSLPSQMIEDDSISGFLTVVHSDTSPEAKELCSAMRDATAAIGWSEVTNEDPDPNYLVILISAQELWTYNQVFKIAEHPSYQGCTLSDYPSWAKNEDGKPKLMFAGHNIPAE